jgi:hypothetical protein
MSIGAVAFHFMCVMGEERAVGRIKERARILRRLLRLRPWPLALAMLALGMAVVLAVGLSGLIRAAISPAFSPVCPDRSRVCWAAPGRATARAIGGWRARLA